MVRKLPPGFSGDLYVMRPIPSFDCKLCLGKVTKRWKQQNDYLKDSVFQYHYLCFLYKDNKMDLLNPPKECFIASI